MEKIFLCVFYKEDVRDIREKEPRNYTMHNGFSSLQSETELKGGLEVGRVLDTSRDTYEIFMELYEFTLFVIVNRRWNGGDIGRRFIPHRKSCFREGCKLWTRLETSRSFEIEFQINSGILERMICK